VQAECRVLLEAIDEFDIGDGVFETVVQGIFLGAGFEAGGFAEQHLGAVADQARQIVRIKIEQIAQRRFADHASVHRTHQIVRGQADALALLGSKAGTASISVAGATSDVSVKVNLSLPDGVTSDTTGQITIVIHIASPASTRSFDVGVIVDGARSDRAYSLSTDSVVVTLGGATAALNALDPTTLVATVSVAGLDNGTHTVSVSFDAPAGIRVLPIRPTEITVTISTGPAPTPTPSPS